MNNKKQLDFQTIAVDFDAVNDNLPEIIEFYGHNSRKISCDYYIDDRMLLPENAKMCIRDSLSVSFFHALAPIRYALPFAQIGR